MYAYMQIKLLNLKKATETSFNKLMMINFDFD